MMTEEQRYLFDLNGYLHIPKALSEGELEAAREAAERYINTAPDDLPEGFSAEGKRHVHGFAFDPALGRLAMHPAIWPIVKELTNNKPRLTSGSLVVDFPNTGDSEPLRLHCARDDFGWDAVRYEVRDGRVFCDDLVAFPYFTDVNAEDGGLLVVPGSHKSYFQRPPGLFNNGVVESLDDLPDGVVNVTPKAGDFVVMNEALTHGALPWQPADRLRMFLVLRYHIQYRSIKDFPEVISGRLSPEIRELTARAGYTDVKGIVRDG